MPPEPAASGIDNGVPRPLAIAGDDVPSILVLNNVHAVELSWLDETRLRTLIDRAFYARQIGRSAAFLLAFDEGADYGSPNYLWFRQRYDRFVYIDRVAVQDSARGRGFAKTLYADLIAQTLASGRDAVMCEVNIDPPNPASDAFHKAMGFEAVGVADIDDGLKTVRYLRLSLPRPRGDMRGQPVSM